MGELVTVTTSSTRDQIAVNHDVLVGVDSAHVAHIAIEIGVDNHRPATHQLGRPRDQPHAVTDDALDDAFLGEGTFQELGCRRQSAQVLGIAQPIGDNADGTMIAP